MRKTKEKEKKKSKKEKSTSSNKHKASAAPSTEVPTNTKKEKPDAAELEKWSNMRIHNFRLKLPIKETPNAAEVAKAYTERMKELEGPGNEEKANELTESLDYFQKLFKNAEANGGILRIDL